MKNHFGVFRYFAAKKKQKKKTKQNKKNEKKTKNNAEKTGISISKQFSFFKRGLGIFGQGCLMSEISLLGQQLWP